MIKKLSTLAALVLIVTSCSIKEDRTRCVAPVSVHLDWFSISQDDFPTSKATQSAVDYTSINNLTVAFYNGSTEVVKLTQSREDPSSFENFGEFSFSLPLGSYTMVALAYKTMEDSPFELTSPTSAAFTGAHMFETFASTQTVNIISTDAINLNATLNRIVAKLEVHSSDGRTANVTNARMSFSAGSKAFNPTTGFATSNTGFSNTVGISAATGSTSNSVSYLFLSTDEQNIDVNIETLDANGNTICSKTVHNVPFKRNRRTILTGALYSSNASADSFQLNTDWETTYNGSF